MGTTSAEEPWKLGCRQVCFCPGRRALALLQPTLSEIPSLHGHVCAGAR